MYAAAITTGNTVKLQISSTVSSFTGSTGSIRTTITGNINKYQTDYQPMSEKFDGYRHTVGREAAPGVATCFVI